MTTFETRTGHKAPAGTLEAAPAVGVVIFLLLNRWTSNAPARALERRPEVGRWRSPTDMWRPMAERYGWCQVAGTLLLVPFG